MTTYRLSREQDAEQINHFYNTQYGAKRTSAEFMRLFHHAPAGHAIYVVAEENGEIIGTQCAIPIMLCTEEGKRILSGKSEETLVAPDYRGQGIFRGMYAMLLEECRKSGIQVIWGFTSVITPFTGIGFSAPYHVKQGIAVKDVLETSKYLAGDDPVGDLARTAAAAGLSLISRVKLWAAAIPDGGEIHEAEVATMPWLCSTELFNANGGTFALDLSEQVVRWRVVDNPQYTKVRRFISTDETGDVQAEFICTISASRMAYILHVTHRTSVATPALTHAVQQLCHKLFSENVIAIRVWAFDHTAQNQREQDALRRAGFTFIDRGMSLVWKDIASGLDPGDFYLSKLAAVY